MRKMAYHQGLKQHKALSPIHRVSLLALVASLSSIPLSIPESGKVCCQAGSTIRNLLFLLEKARRLLHLLTSDFEMYCCPFK